VEDIPARTVRKRRISLFDKNNPGMSERLNTIGIIPRVEPLLHTGEQE